MSVFRTAQGYSLSSNRVAIAAAAQGTVVGTAQIALGLEELVVEGEAATGGLVTAIRIAGQEIIASNAAVPVACFNNRLAGMSGGFRSMGLTVDQSQTVAIDVNNTSAAAGNFSFSLTTTPIAQSMVVPTSQSGDALNYIFGFGEIAIGAGATVNLTATALRPTVLGRLVIVEQSAVGPGGTLAGVTLDSILINNIEILSGAAADSIPASACGVLSTYTGETNQIAYPVSLNSQCTLQLTNNTAAPLTVGAAAYCLPR